MRLIITAAVLLTWIVWANSQTPTPAVVRPEPTPATAIGVEGVLRGNLARQTDLDRLAARLEALTPAGTIDEWVASDFQRTLAPGIYTVTEQIRFYQRSGVHLRGPSKTLMDPVGQLRALWANSPDAQCIILFDLPAETPGILLQGCTSFVFEGINFCRTTPGAMIQDENAAGANSFDHTLRHCGFYCRTVRNDRIPDPFRGAGIITDKTGHVGFKAVGTNGTDSYHFDGCYFDTLDKCCEMLTPQMTKCLFTNCRFMRSNYIGWFGPNPAYEYLKTGSGNPAYYSCTRYDCGPIVLDHCANATSNVSWIGGWGDSGSGRPARPLVDFSRTGWGTFALVGGSGKKMTATPDTNEPLIIPSINDGWPRFYQAGRVPQGQPILPEGYTLNGDRVEKVK